MSKMNFWEERENSFPQENCKGWEGVDGCLLSFLSTLWVGEGRGRYRTALIGPNEVLSLGLEGWGILTDSSTRTASKGSTVLLARCKVARPWRSRVSIHCTPGLVL